VSLPSAGVGAGPPIFDGLSGLGDTMDPDLTSVGGFPFLVLDSLCLLDSEAAATS
jgi:hypothetical protein